MILLKCIGIMIHFGECIKYQYRDTILNQVSVSVSRLIEHGFTSAPTQYRLYGSRYNLEVSYPTLVFDIGP